jgi:hypothetical protein
VSFLQGPWRGIARAIAYPQGVLLKMKSGALFWLPDLSLTEGSPADALQLLGAKVRDYVAAAK